MIHEKPEGKRARRRRERTRQILDAALELVRQGGPDGLALAELAERIDAAVGALYRYYPSKEALLDALGPEASAKIASELRDAVAAADRRHGGTVWERSSTAHLRRLLRATEHLDRVRADEPHLFELLARLRADAPEHAVRALFSELLRSAREADALDSGDDERRGAIWTGAVLHQPDRVHLGALARVLARGWGADRDALREADQ